MEIFNPNPDGIARAAAVLRGGGVVGFPTETVFGLGAAVGRPAAVERLWQLKGRERNQPLILMAAAIEEMAPFLAWSEAAERWASRFWPGPLTLILPSRELGRALGGGNTIGARIPNHRVALALLRQSGPLATTSANPHGKPTAPDAAAALDELPGLDGAVADLTLAPGSSTPSSILDLTRDQPILIREGALSVGQLGIQATEQEPGSRRD